MSMSFAALAAIWCSPPSAAAAAHPERGGDADASSAPAATKKTAGATSTVTATADVHPARRPVDRGPNGEELPPLTKLETAIAACFLTLWCGAPFIATLLGVASLFALLFGQWRLALAGWSTFALAFATLLIPAGSKGPSARVRSSRLLSIIRRYFFYSVACETPLDPDRPYLFASYPHGTMPIAPLLGMTVYKAASWHGKEFVGGAASSVFMVPGWRQGLRLIGCVPADRARLLRALREGCSVGLCPGGISEMYKFTADAASAGAPCSSGGGAKTPRHGSGNDDPDPLFGATAAAVSRYEHAVLMERRGFVALAIEAGVDICPVYYFGNSLLFAFGPRWLERLGRKIKVSLGVLVGAYGLPCPHRVPLMQAVGRPVPVPRTDKKGQPLVRGTPEFEQAVDHVHALYKKELERTYEHFKPVYGGGRFWQKRRLVIH
jgi:1-acyl-sn-glycerol-3-phosphate acyltransferase